MIAPRFDLVPDELVNRRQWILWKVFRRSGKDVKVPWSVYDVPASSTDAATWHEYEVAVCQYDPDRHAGIGFVFAVGDGFAGVDLDSCRDPMTGQIQPWAQKYLDECADAYVEVSPSGTGVKMWLKSDLVLDKGRNFKIDAVGTDPAKKPGIEMYTQGRYFAVTGHRLRDFVR